MTKRKRRFSERAREGIGELVLAVMDWDPSLTPLSPSTVTSPQMLAHLGREVESSDGNDKPERRRVARAEKVPV